MKATLFVSYEVGQEIIDMLSAGTMVSLQRQPDNAKDPYAVQVLLGETPIGYLANSKNTVLPETLPAARISQQLDKPNVDSCYAKLLATHDYNDKERARWEVELFWIPVWGDGAGKKKEPILLKVGGTKVLHSNIATVMAAIDSYKDGKLTLTMYDNGNTGLVPTVWISGTENQRGSSPAGQVQNPPAELITALSTGGAIKVQPTKVLDKGNYQVEAILDNKDMSSFYPEMSEVIKRGVMQARDVKERVKYLLEQMVPDSIIRGVLNSLHANETESAVIKPKQLFLQTAENNYLTRSIAYHLAGKNIRLVGEKGAGKNTLVYTVCWVMNQPLCRIQGNSDMDKTDLLGGQALDDHGTHFQLSGFIKMLMEGGDVVLDEINSVKPEIAIILHSLADEARAIDVPGYGYVEISPNSRIWATMNEAYIGTGEMNAATADRFVPIYLEDQTNIQALLTAMVPAAKKEHIDICVSLYEKVRKAVHESRCDMEALTTRGYIDALESAVWLPLRASLMDNIANRPQEPETRAAIADFIRALCP